MISSIFSIISSGFSVQGNSIKQSPDNIKKGAVFLHKNDSDPSSVIASSCEPIILTIVDVDYSNKTVEYTSRFFPEGDKMLFSDLLSDYVFQSHS